MHLSHLLRELYIDDLNVFSMVCHHNFEAFLISDQAFHPTVSHSVSDIECFIPAS